MLSMILGGLALFVVDGHEANADVVAACDAYQAEYGGEADCTCLGKKAADDEALAAEILAIATPEDIAAASESVMTSVQACTAS